jgi:hypothetical protein
VIEVPFETYTYADRVVVMDFIIDVCTFLPSRPTLIDLAILSDIVMIGDSCHGWIAFPIQMHLVYVFSGERPSYSHMVDYDVFRLFPGQQGFSEFEIGAMYHILFELVYLKRMRRTPIIQIATIVTILITLWVRIGRSKKRGTT